MANFSETGSVRVAYLIMAHKLPAQLRRLIERLSGPEARFLISVDAQSDLSVFEQELRGLPVEIVQPRFVTSWGRYNLLRAKLAGMRQLIASREAFDNLFILSGQDYPLVSRAALLDYVVRHRGHSFVHHVPVTRTDTHLLSRLEKYHLFIPFNRAIIYPYDSANWVKRGINQLLRLSGQFPLPRRLPLNYTLHFGSNWLQLSARATQFILAQMQANPAIEQYFQYTILPEEHMFQTMLLNATEAQRGLIQNLNYTFSHWHRPPELYAQPLSLTDLDAMLSSGCLMARKFDVTYDSSVLTWLDANAS